MAATRKTDKGTSTRGNTQKAEAEAARGIGSAPAGRDTAADRITGRPLTAEELDFVSLGAASAGNRTGHTQIMDHTDFLDDVLPRAGGREMVEPTEATGNTEVAGKAGVVGRIKAAFARAGGFFSERPDGRMRIAVGAAAGFALLFLVLAVVGFSIASSRADRLEELEQDAARLREELASHAGGADVEKWKTTAGEEEQARKSSEEDVARLEAALAEAKAESDDVRAKLEASRGEAEALENALLGAEEDPEDATLDPAQEDQLQTELEEALRLLTGAREELTALRAEHSQAVDEDARLQKVVGWIERGKALPEDQAEQQFRAAIETAAAVDDPDKRTDLFGELTLALAGTKYGPRAARLWNREKKLRQGDIDRAAADVYKKALRRIRSTPKAHEENVETLKSALPGVDGSRYEKTTRELIEREEAKASK